MTHRIGGKFAFCSLPKRCNPDNKARPSVGGEVWSGILSGDLNIGSRKPVTGMPEWAIPEAIRGGFATGSYAAGGALLGHERALADALGFTPKGISETRVGLNEWFLTDQGLSELRVWIGENRYQADTPEEMALICVTLLAETNPDGARKVLEAIAPFFDRLRFYPCPLLIPRQTGLHVNSVRNLRKILAKIRPRKDILQQYASLTVWIPLYDKLVDLLSSPNADSWKEAARSWMNAYEAADKTLMSSRWSKTGSAFDRLKQALQSKIVGTPLSLRDNHYVQLQINRHNEKYGIGADRAAYRERQLHQNTEIWHDTLAAVALERIVGFVDEDGIAEVGPLSKAVKQAEARKGAPEGAALPVSIARKINSTKIGTVAELIEGGQIPSPEILGVIMPQLTAQLYARGFPDEASGHAYASTYRAFHRRRSLLLLNLESQVKLSELPWAKALLSLQLNQEDDISDARALLNELVQYCLIHFPHVQFPNPLIEQMQDLGKRAAIETPFVAELAADIFMGSFSKNFEAAVTATMRHFTGTVYARYYSLPEKMSLGTLGELCQQRAGLGPRQGWSVAYNGMVIEQAMIMTSHNLANVFDNLPLKDVDFGVAAIKCFQWACARLSLPSPSRHAELISLKQSAYAWRQMIAFLSRLSLLEQQSTFAQMHAILDEQSPELQRRIMPIVTGVQIAISGERVSFGQIPPFLGWSITPHPLSQYQ